MSSTRIWLVSLGREIMQGNGARST